MPSGQSSRVRWGLRTRMTVYISVVIGITLGTAFLWSVYNLRAELEARNDLFLKREFIEFVHSAQTSLRDRSSSAPLAALRAEAAVHAETGLFVVVHYGSELQVLPDQPDARNCGAALRTIALDETPRTVIPDGMPAGVLAMRKVLSTADSGDWTVDLCLRLAETEATIANYKRRLAGGGAAFLAVAVLAGVFVTRQALRPVAASIQAAQRLNPNDLSARLPQTGAGDEIDLLAATINDLLERLTRYHEQMIRFTADASHELRGPLSAMRAGVEVALQQPRTADDYRETLESLGEQCQHLTDLVNKLLLLARADAGQIELRRDKVNLAEVVAEAVDTYRPLADEKRVALDWYGPGPVWCVGDRMRLSQLVMNLLDNAVKYTGPAGAVRLALAAEGATAAITVEDTGIGIGADRLPHIFERFYQVDSSRSEEGTGLGLSICRWVAAAHQGSINVTSQPGRGTHFRVALPRVALDIAVDA